MKYNRIFFLSFLIAAFVACSSAPEEVIVTLRQAEQCMEVYPVPPAERFVLKA